jgi:hypothetical protein
MDREERLAKRREYYKKYRAENAEKIAASQRAYNSSEKGKAVRKAIDKRWREKNPERAKQFARDYHAANRAEIVERNKWYKLEKQFGLTKEAFFEMLETQGMSCACCGTTDPLTRGGKTWCVDHCHTSGKVRGILCSHCNTGLGMARDSIPMLEAWIKYLQR